jgi:2-amino-4-hydroxy-6-hydroxymethyldihydropteridine diphosphokinase
VPLRAGMPTDMSHQALACVPRHRAYVGLGGNVGDVHACLLAALDGMHALPGTRVEAVSSVYQSKPVDAGGPDYLNAVAVLQSSLGPHELLHALLRLELAHDRQRPYWHAPRTLDLDLLSYGGVSCHTRSLTLPHPRMMVRAFVLEPLAEVQAGLTPLHDEPVLTLPPEHERITLVADQGIHRAGAMNWGAKR